ncbi:MAG: aldolase/citrate lyase family protein [Pelagibacterium sp.]|jgi:4-hydroxy-2-oxoheptanedioate aldolase|uniref:HpcH/HpaI aldolase family protein n=1 Tax=Pelagibacterium sp. TaxID=1967288 RepID=UPI0032EAB31B|tara:strand:- start:24085 stop:24948 length:864 start_codon:yes stop_codon:yes gene_type:complete
MTQIPRLNGIIAALEKGQHAVMSFAKPEIEEAIAFSTSRYDGIMLETEHNIWDGRGLRDAMQYLLNRRQLVTRGTLAPSVTPIVRIPPNGGEMNQWFAKQALDLGAYGVVWPHITSVEEAYNAVSACRYPRLPTAPLAEPSGVRGDGPHTACRYWGLTNLEYYERADVWPLAPQGEILVLLMIEDTKGIANLRDILKNVPGIGGILIGEGDLGQELGFPRQYDHPALREAMGEILAISTEAGVPVGHPHVEPGNVERIVEEGYRILLTPPARSYASLDKTLKLVGRG